MNLPSRGLRLSATTIRNTGVFLAPTRFMRIFTDINLSKERGDYRCADGFASLVLQKMVQENHNIGIFVIGQNFLARNWRAQRLQASQRGGGGGSTGTGGGDVGANSTAGYRVPAGCGAGGVGVGVGGTISILVASASGTDADLESAAASD